MTGTAVVTVDGALPVSLPVSAAVTGGGLQLTVAGITLPSLPIGTGGTEIG